MNVLAIDPGASTSGYAIYFNGDIVSGTREFSSKASDGDRYYEYFCWLERLSIGYNIDFVVIEQPTPVNNSSAAIQHGLFAIAKLFAASIDVAYLEFNPMSMQKYVRDSKCNDSKFAEAKLLFSNVKESKQDTMALFYLECGKIPKTHDEADAYALLKYALSEQEKLSA